MKKVFLIYRSSCCKRSFAVKRSRSTSSSTATRAGLRRRQSAAQDDRRRGPAEEGRVCTKRETWTDLERAAQKIASRGTGGRGPRGRRRPTAMAGLSALDRGAYSPAPIPSRGASFRRETVCTIRAQTSEARGERAEPGPSGSFAPPADGNDAHGPQARTLRVRDGRRGRSRRLHLRGGPGWRGFFGDLRRLAAPRSPPPGAGDSPPACS